MLSEEEEMSLTSWGDLLGTELTIALEELSKNHKDSANKRHQYYVESCAEQYWTIIARITAMMGKRRADWISPDSNDQRTGNVPSVRTMGERSTGLADLEWVHLHSPIRRKSSQEIFYQDFQVSCEYWISNELGEAMTRNQCLKWR
jgi:hypothetical protein